MANEKHEISEMQIRSRDALAELIHHHILSWGWRDQSDELLPADKQQPEYLAQLMRTHEIMTGGAA